MAIAVVPVEAALPTCYRERVAGGLFLHRRLWAALRRPEYVFRPQQVCRRLLRRRLLARGAVTLAWGLPIVGDPNCLIFGDIVNLGVYDKGVAESVCRLLDPGECAVDAGANIGQNTSIMAVAAGATGRVYSVEPHPAILPILRSNVERWRSYQVADIVVCQTALGARRSTAHLHEPAAFAGNSGCGSLLVERGAGIVHNVPVETLDGLLAPGTHVHLLKLDVEGCELDVLNGAERLLAHSFIRDIIYEDYAPQPSALRTFLEVAGYAVFALTDVLGGPVVTPMAPVPVEHPAANFIASLDPRRVVERFRSRGWRCLRSLAQPRRQPNGRHCTGNTGPT